MIWTGSSGSSALAAELQANPELAAVLGSPGDFNELYRGVVLSFYGSVIALTVVFQGLNAAYYFLRRKHVLACKRETPEWALTLQRAKTGG
jgi:hypothetical protein